MSDKESVIHPYTVNRPKVKITVLKIFHPDEVFKNPPVTHVDPWGPCKVFKEGEEFIVSSGKQPEGFCGSAWHTIYHNVRTLSVGGEFGYFKDKKGAIISCCSDGLRPVVFQLERID